MLLSGFEPAPAIPATYPISVPHSGSVPHIGKDHPLAQYRTADQRVADSRLEKGATGQGIADTGQGIGDVYGTRGAQDTPSRSFEELKSASFITPSSETCRGSVRQNQRVNTAHSRAVQHA
eukprot:2198356-Rhodomonas_salina.3